MSGDAVPSLKHGSWQTDLPAEDGDWFYIRQWACGCCLIESGIAWVQEWRGTAAEWDEWGEENPSSYNYRYVTPDGRMWTVAWGRDPGRIYQNGKPGVHWWQKVTLPPYPDDILDPITPDPPP